MKAAVENDIHWQRIRDLDIDRADAELPFSRRLARENGWSVAYAKRVIAEYKRFLFLATCQSQSVTPSDEVDQAWHLHMLYSRHYWHELCDRVLGQPLHHGPTAGGKTESAKYKDWYERTLRLYSDTFGEAPPPDVWPDCRTRFSSVDQFRRVNAATHFIIPRLPSRITTLVIASLFLTGCFAFFEDGENAWGIFIVIALAFVVWKIIKAGFSDGGFGGGGCGSGCGGCGGCS